PEWDAQRWGLPISQSAMLLTLLGGSVAPAFGLYPLGHLTSPREMRAVLHFNRYCGHLVGVRCDGYFPETVADAWRILVMADAARSYDSADTGRELVESFVPAFAPAPAHRGLARLRAEYHYRVQAGYLGLYMLPWNRRRYRLPSALPGILLLLLRSPVILALELARRASDGVDGWWQRTNLRRWENWLQWQSDGKAAAFEAAAPLRR
ncbi:MAG: oxygenase MpaB family protein, partial [Actinomycetota bacterium]|nr:oxygenase MpaB family protein [Actinomycetota bacterium]